MRPKRPSLYSASRGLWNWHTELFPLPLFSLPMSSAGAQPGVCSSPPDQRPLLGGGKNSSRCLWLYKVDLWNQASDLRPQLEVDAHRAHNSTTLFLSLFFQSCISTPVPCRETHFEVTSSSVSGPSLHRVLVVGGLFLEISEINMLS